MFGPLHHKAVPLPCRLILLNQAAVEQLLEEALGLVNIPGSEPHGPLPRSPGEDPVPVSHTPDPNPILESRVTEGLDYLVFPDSGAN